nr:MAG TPA: hypothetical protein [Siphoviridae sp. ctoof1]
MSPELTHYCLLKAFLKSNFLKIAKFLHLHFHNGIQEKSKCLEGKTLNE